MIRNAELEDVTDILALLFTRPLPPSHTWMKVSVSKVSEILTYLISKPNSLVFVSEHNKQITGIIVGELFEVMFGHAISATDYALVIRDGFEHKGLGYKLLLKFQEEAIKAGAERINTTVPLCNFNGDSMDKLLLRNGYQLFSKTYYKDIQ